MNSRREFLKLFGVGAAIVPIIGGVPIATAEAKIVEPPKVEIAKNFSLMGEVSAANFGAIGQHGIIVIFERPDGTRSVLTAKTFVTSIDQTIKEIRGRDSRFPQDFAFNDKKLHWKMEGDCYADAAGKLAEFYDDV